MKLIVGLGNPGREYAGTRHNVGARWLQFLARKMGGTPWKEEKKFFALMSEIKTADGEKILLCFPQTFMNLSGRAVQAIMQFYKLEMDDLIVAHDDLDIALGQYKIAKRGPKTHNGLADIAARVGANDFLHVRIGIEARAGDHRIPGLDYVLLPFSDEELETLDGVFEEIARQIIAA